MNLNRLNTLQIYSLLLAFHFLHIIEEFLGHASFIDVEFSSIQTWISSEIVFFFISLLIFFFTLKGNKIAFHFSILYSAIMIVDGAYHIVMYFFEKSYYGGSAGAITGAFIFMFLLPF